MKAHELFSPSAEFPFADFFLPDVAPWEWVPQIGEALDYFFATQQPNLQSDPQRGIIVTGPVWCHPQAVIGPQVVIEGPAWLGAGVQIRPGAYLRGRVIADKGVLLGHCSEFKNALLLEGSQIPHFNYVGDSVLGACSHLGAGVILSNLRFDHQSVTVKDFDGCRHDTGLAKLGGLIGDHAEVGCQSVLQPGSILGKKALVYPTLSFAGTLLPENHFRGR